jgi:tagatose 1,6-diphosphate aldolase GatY/KbaY
VIARFAELVGAARRRKTAVGAFTCYDAESVAGVLRAAGHRPVIILVSARLIAEPQGDLAVAGFRAMVERAQAPACLQLDHAHDLDAIRAGCEAGVGAVMADGSHLPRDLNAEFVIAARAMAAPLGVAVEGELGTVAGDEEVAVPADAGALTDPAEVKRFVSDTGVDCLAVAIGNVHGIYRGRPRLDFPLLRHITTATTVPLALHGASGLPTADVRRAVQGGIAKVNVNTALRQAYLARTARELPRAVNGAGLLALHRAQARAVEAASAHTLTMLSSARA